jgi:fructoselysine-6-P-deglycase FrlB-like protein
MLEKDYNLRTIAISCAEGQPLEAACSVTLKLLDANEQSTVMTRSFTSMLLGLQYLGATVSERRYLQKPLQRAGGRSVGEHSKCP